MKKFFVYLFFIPFIGFSLSVEELMGQFDVRKNTNFTRFISGKKVFYLRKEAYQALQRMFQQAQKDNINLSVVSAFRSFDDQKSIWETKWKRYAFSHPDPKSRCLWILQYSSAPGTSRHHWGTDVDLVSVDPNYFTTKEGQKILAWLETNAPSYGFIRPYTSNPNRKGYKEEPWHWSYAPLSVFYLALYTNEIPLTKIKGFEGWEILQTIELKEYILGINPLLLPENEEKDKLP